MGIDPGKDGEDRGPQAAALPILVPCVRRMPVPKLRRQRAPRGAGLHDPQDSREERGGVFHRTAALLRWGEQGCNPLPALVGQSKDRSRAGDWCATPRDRSIHPCPPCRVALLRVRLVPSPKVRPCEPDVGPFGWLGEDEQEATDFWNRQREEVAGPLFALPRRHGASPPGRHAPATPG
jgi:hypothetical protein